jgi:hypothetical protein
MDDWRLLPPDEDDSPPPYSLWSTAFGDHIGGGGGVGGAAPEVARVGGIRGAKGKPVQRVEALIRPDKSWQSVKEAVSRGALSRRCELEELHEGGLGGSRQSQLGKGAGWTRLSVEASLTPSKQRALIINLFLEVTDVASLLPDAVAAESGRREVEALCRAIFESLEMDGILLHCLENGSEEAADPVSIAEMLDEPYLLHVVQIAASGMAKDLANYALPLEQCVNREERASAELAVALMPAYKAVSLPLPRPARARPLKTYALSTSCPSLGTVDRDSVRRLAVEAAGDVQGEHLNSYRECLQEVLMALWAKIEQMCTEEANARMQRKDLQVRDRLKAVEEYRLALIGTLRESKVPSKDFTSRFRPLASDTVLLECGAALGAKVGKFYLTSNHATFYSSLLGFVTQIVIPLASVSLVERRHAALGMEVLAIAHGSAEEHIFTFTAGDGHFDRVFDLVQQVLRIHRDEHQTREEQPEGGGVFEVPAACELHTVTAGAHIEASQRQEHKSSSPVPAQVQTPALCASKGMPTGENTETSQQQVQHPSSRARKSSPAQVTTPSRRTSHEKPVDELEILARVQAKAR